MRELLAELTAAVENGRPCVYCSVVETRGSTPQKAGAAMLVFPDGGQRGTLGGGCVEAEVKQRALRVLAQNEQTKAEVLTFSLDDNYGWDDGLICGGRMRILADPLTGASPASRYYQHLNELIGHGHGCTEAAVLEDRHANVAVGSRFLFDASGTLVDQFPAGSVPECIDADLIPLRKRPKAYVKNGIAYLPTLPRITLLIVGGGHVGQAVARLAADVDFDIWVLDDREAYASKDRFPMAKQVIVGDIGESLKQMTDQIQPSIYALIVTRGHSHDEEALYHLANTSAGYVGMIGSKRKIKLIFDDLLARDISPESLQKVHAPLGFAIGSQTVPEIAVSIVAELIACRNLGATIPEARINVKL